MNTNSDVIFTVCRKRHRNLCIHHCTIVFFQAMQEAMMESKAKKFYLYSGHDYTGSFASNFVFWWF